MKQKKFFMMVAILIGVMSLPQPSEAVLQANPNTNGAKTDTPTNWMSNIRNMEKANQAMGLEETIDSTTKKATSGSNGIDVHMIKTTEYGAVAILSASGYGNSKPIQVTAIKSTTGNKTGVYFPLSNWEWTAGSLAGYFGGVDSRYYDSYTTSNSSAKVGDALGTASTTNPGCTNWYGNPQATWIGGSDGFVRGNSKLFSYAGLPINGEVQSHCVVVCGDGF